jgi:hypothetical protein
LLLAQREPKVGKKKEERVTKKGSIPLLLRFYGVVCPWFCMLALLKHIGTKLRCPTTKLGAKL